MNDSSTYLLDNKTGKTNHSSSRKLQEQKTWTIRKISPETIAHTKAAANRSGMKIGAWVERQLLNAVSESSITSKQNELVEGIREIANDLNGHPDEFSEEWREKMETNMDQLIKGQHNLMIMVQELKNK